MDWDPRFCDRSPMLQPFAAFAARFAECADWPPLAAMASLVSAQGIRNARGLPLRVVASAGAPALSYESRTFESGALEVREGEWHDLFNVLAWTAYPLTKAALNARHVKAAREDLEGGRPGDAAAANRGRVRDALTLFDESGAIFVSSEADLIDDLRTFRWKKLFWEQRQRVRASVRVFVFGHAMLEKALAPYVGMTAHVIAFHVDRDFLEAPPRRQLESVDELAAAYVADPAQLRTPQDLAPLPVLGVPDWWPDNERGAFYDDASHFRAGRTRRP
jgi:hypothetical protein